MSVGRHPARAYGLLPAEHGLLPGQQYVHRLARDFVVTLRRHPMLDRPPAKAFILGQDPARLCAPGRELLNGLSRV